MLCGRRQHLTADCRLRGFNDRAVEAYYHKLDMITLEALVRDNCGLEAILKLAPQRLPRCSDSTSATS